MRTSQAGIDLITSFEGFFADWYLDPVGVRTVGYGHTDEKIPAGITVPLTKAEALRLLQHDLAGYEAAVGALVKVPVSQPQFDALVSFAFNVGTGALASSTLLAKLNRRDYHGAQEQFSRWVRGGGRVLPGLVRRRKAEADLFAKGNEGSPTPRAGWRWTKARVMEFQRLHNAFRGKWLDGHGLLAEDGQRGPATKAAVKEDKKLLGYVPSAQTWSGVNRPFFLRLRHPTFGLNRRQVRRGIAARAAYRHNLASTDTVQGCARFLLASPNVEFLYRDDNGDTARAPIEDLAAGRKAKVNHDGSRTTVSLHMMQALVDMARHGVIAINCLTNGNHSNGSNHYIGHAVDLQVTVGNAGQIVAIAEKHGGSRNFETDHIHLDF